MASSQDTVARSRPREQWADNLRVAGRHEHRSLVSYLETTEACVMWFVAALLTFSVAYATLRRLRPAARPRPLLPGLLAAAAVAIAVSSFAVWQPWPVMGDTFLSLRWGEWPQGAVLFALGVHGAEAGWLRDFPPMLARRLGWMAAARVAALMMLMGHWPWHGEWTRRWRWAPTCPRWSSRCSTA